MGKSKMIIAGIIVFALSSSEAEVGAAVSIDVAIIAEIESGNDATAVNARESALGAHQIRECVIEDYNDFGPGRSAPLAHFDVFDPIVSAVVADWYVNRRIPAMLKCYGYPDTTATRLIAYNAGIKYARPGKHVPSSTLTYIKKYLSKLQ